jgi:thiosulfate/3-mercaptopyruvate sulfurtransferase
MDPLVSTEWLAEHLGAPDLVVFDATYYLPTENKDAKALFAHARIPGARFFDIGDIADPDTDLPHMVPTPGRFEKLLSALGVSNTSRIVFYDQKGLQSAARGWWMMGLFGHDQAAVLDGGLPKWLREARATENGPATPPTPAHFQATYRPTRLRGLGDMRAPAAGTIVLDARAAARFEGTAIEPRPGLPSGHMPGSRNIPSTTLLNPDGTVLPPDRLRAVFAAQGVDGTKPVITSCGTGVTATILTLGMVRAGLPMGAVYDGSWTEWASRPDAAIETGPIPAIKEQH